MKKLTKIWTIIGIIVAVAAACAAVFFALRRKAARAEAPEDENIAPETAAAPEAAETQAQSA